MSDREDKFMLILDRISEVSERTARMETKMDVMEKDIEFIKEEDRKQNELLDQHIQGVKTNTSRLEEEKRARELAEIQLKKRVDKLEESPKFWGALKTRVLQAGGIAAALYTILKLLEVL